jgi:caa(3)-type oxidase subunit IV
MTAYLRNRLTGVWAFLTAITVASWLIGRGHGGEYEIDVAVTVGVLLMAAVKAQLVIQYFMEVRSAPRWMKRTVYGWVVGLFLPLLGVYWASL